MHKYPIGIQNFKKIRDDNYLYIDKTKIIYELISNGAFYFLSRPRRFGKSLLLSTIKEIFSGNKELFKGLWIENNWNWAQQSPIVYISFSNIGIKTIGLSNALSLSVLENAERLGITIDSSAIDQQFKELLQKASANGKVALLIDEYDKPIVDFLDNIPQAEENRSILKSFYSIVKDADAHIRFMLITGVSKFSKVSIFSDLNNLHDITISEKMSSLVGITQQELETNFSEELPALATKFNWVKSILIDKIKQWYNGYSWTGPETVYNPFSILLFMSGQQFQNYWFETGTPTFLINEMKKQGQFWLDEEEEVPLLTLGHFDIERINFKTVLFQTGYLTIDEVHFEEGWCRLRYPNKEVKFSLEQYLAAAYSYVSPGESLSPVLKMRTAFNKDNISEVISIINTQFATIPYDLWRNATELHYHALVHLTFSLLGNYVESEVHSSNGRCDAIVKTPTHVYAFEFKLDVPASVALQQIIEKNYLSPYMQLPSIKMAIGVCFSSENKKINEFLMQVF